MDDSLDHGRPLFIGQLLERAGEHTSVHFKAHESLHALELIVVERDRLDAEAPPRAPLHRTGAVIAGELIASDPVEPRDRLARSGSNRAACMSALANVSDIRSAPASALRARRTRNVSTASPWRR